ncbi:hypothetical protein QBC46DRAFT_382689 [Diplogelasinospora grovesii]|uniref:Cyanovirin-N domain-containing protein n=1 Tax=Diplogelasinospora grovesii TaxID=303347 RepID=A0AAN6NBX9_9PEZI|nr:hypothetical protein QBC46DRAFT_382689 [Diplogelasinospora grovesii]
MRFGILTATAAAMLAGFGAADDGPVGFTPKCDSWNLPIDYGVTTMQGQCASNNTQGVTCSEVDLNACYANMNGTLVAATNGKGDFYRTCSNCTTVNYKPPQIQCRCWGTDGNGNRVQMDTQVLNLDEHIRVNDDRLGCIGYEGHYCCGKRCPDPTY